MKVKNDHRSKFSNLSKIDCVNPPVTRRSRVRIPLKPWFFSGFFFPTAYDDDDTATKWYSLVAEYYIINKEQDSMSLAYPY